MSSHVNIAYLADGWLGSGVYGDFTACGFVSDAEGTPLNGTEFEGHVHEIPLVPVGMPEPLASIFGQTIEDDEISGALRMAMDLLADAGWDDNVTEVVSAEDFMRGVEVAA